MSFYAPPVDLRMTPTTLQVLPCSPFVSAEVVEVRCRSSFPTLTAREIEIVGLLIDDWPVAKIAAKLACSPNAVYCVMKKLARKLGVKSTLAAVASILLHWKGGFHVA